MLTRPFENEAPRETGWSGKGAHMNNFKKAMEAVKEFLADIVDDCIENPGFVYDMVVSGISLAISISVLLRK